MREEVEFKISSDSARIDIVEQTIVDGVTKVDTKTGISFDENGMEVNKTNSPTNTKITENGMTVNNNETGLPVLTANKDGVDAKNLHATTYLIVGGNSRFEDYEVDGSKRTACFWIGE